MAASVMACRVAALFNSRRLSSRRDVGAAPGAASDPPDGAAGAAEGNGEEGTRVHYVHICTLRKYFPGVRPDGNQGLSWDAVPPGVVVPSELALLPAAPVPPEFVR